MAYRLDPKNCNFYFQDGFSGVGEIDDAAIMAGDTTLLIDPAENDLHDDATLIPVGARFTLPDDEEIYTVTARNANTVYSITIGADTTGSYVINVNGVNSASIAGTDNAAAVLAALEAMSNIAVGDVSVSGTGTVMDPFLVEFTGVFVDLAVTVTATPTDLDNFADDYVYNGNETWRITFTPPIDASAVPSTADVITFLPQRLTMKLGDGDFEWEENTEVIQDRDRGILDGRRLGDEQPMTVSCTSVIEFVRASSGQPIKPYEALHRLGGASTWHSTSSSPCEPYCIDLIVEHIPPCGSEEAERYTFPEFISTTRGGNFSDATLTLEGECNALKPDIERYPNPTAA